MTSNNIHNKAPYTIWGNEIDEAAIDQLKDACSLPISVAGALMPDAHVGYGLPIGGVLATKNAVIPYAVGMDIACRVHMSIVDIPVSHVQSDKKSFIKAIKKCSRFGVGSSFRKKKSHSVMDEDWNFSTFIAGLKNKAWEQLGTSGSGNHFIDIGILEIQKKSPLSPGRYCAILTHSGSRGTGAAIATHYSKIAMQERSTLPKSLKHLSWLNLKSSAGLEYWLAMKLMGRYSAANHELIHQSLLDALSTEAITTVENHHNFAWREKHNGSQVVIHRKGATPASKNDFGIIPGTMATPSYFVQGKGVAQSLNSCAHGAGRKLSRKAAKKTCTWETTQKILDKKGIALISAGLDESPLAYKDIETVMAAQADLVDVLGVFHPAIIKMA